jgi:alkylresorcinol/alkylpyrone synthase
MESARMHDPVSLLGLATAVPAHIVDQDDIARLAPVFFREIFSQHPGMAEIFAHTGIERRHIVRPLDWFLEPRDWRDRATTYVENACDLFIEAAQAALKQAKLAAEDVDIVVTVSSTGIATPSIDARVGPRLGLRRDTTRVPLFGLGCAGGVSGLGVAARLARAEPGKIVLMVALELCSLAFRFDQASKTELVAAALFGDGAAAAVLRAGTGGLARIGRAAEYTWPDTLDIMGWTVDPVGFGVVLSQSLPRFLEQHLALPATRFAAAMGLNGTKPQPICHIGSTKVLAATETALGLDVGTLANERDVLRYHGNMSSPSVLFVLKRALAGGQSGPTILSALGPGFTASFVAADLGEIDAGYADASHA